MQEEIAHCAAGVRWLTYLHTQALTANHNQQHEMNQQMQNATLAEPCLTSDTSSGSSSRPKQSSDPALDVQHKSKACHLSGRNASEACSKPAASGMSVKESTQAAATVMQTSCDGHEAHAASEPEAKGSFSQAAKDEREDGVACLAGRCCEVCHRGGVVSWPCTCALQGFPQGQLTLDIPNTWL